MKHKGCKSLVLALLIGFAATGLARVVHEVPLAGDLVAEGARAEQACAPLLLEFAAKYCEYCTLLEEETLKPMLRNRDYDQRVLVRKLVLDRERRLPDFSGEKVLAIDLANDYGVEVAPTLLFVDAGGRELSGRMVGITTLDFYGGYLLDQSLDASRRKLRELNRCH